jgi:hypothetical protein
VALAKMAFGVRSGSTIGRLGSGSMSFSRSWGDSIQSEWKAFKSWQNSR